MGNDVNSLTYAFQQQPDLQCPSLDATHLKNKQVTHLNEIPIKVLEVLSLKKPFEKQLEQLNNQTYKIIRNGVYLGQLDIHKKQQRYGKIIYADGSVFVGKFQNGKANGPCLYIFRDGSWFEGSMIQNQSQGLGTFSSQYLSYDGQFKDNVFHGKGKQTGREKINDNEFCVYQFYGSYENGEKKFGELNWKIQQKNHNNTAKQWNCHYKGQFYQNRFHGKGVLTSPQGVYDGQFKNGLKHGYSTFLFDSDALYEGYYVNGKRHGAGTLYHAPNQDDTSPDRKIDKNIAFKGQFFEGFPEGQGLSYNQDIQKLTKIIGLSSKYKN